MSDSEYVSIDKIELKRLQADSEELSKLRAHPAALAPAAVVMPGRKTRDPIDWDECSREMATDDAQFCGFNAALDEVARLNRRAIPLGLIESVCEDLAAELDAKYGDMKDHPVMSLSYRKDMADLNELRALLGKEGE